MPAVEMTYAKSDGKQAKEAPTGTTKEAPKKSCWGKIIPDTFYASK